MSKKNRTNWEHNYIVVAFITPRLGRVGGYFKKRYVVNARNSASALYLTAKRLAKKDGVNELHSIVVTRELCARTREDIVVSP